MNVENVNKLPKEKNTQNQNVKYFYNIEDFPKFKILEDNYERILDELVSVIRKEKQIDLDLKQTNIPKNEKIQINQQEESEKNITNQKITFILEEQYENEENKYPKENEKLEETQNSRTFEPWVEKNLYEESNELGWDVAPLMIGGVKIPERCEKFPILFELVGKISGVISVSYSLLKPGTHIVPHKGYDDYSEKMFRYHMGMIVPEGDIGIRVEKEIRKWYNGKSFVFDDFMIHEAWNFTSQNRLVLIIDFLKDENVYPEGIRFFDENFNKSVKGYLK